MDVQILKSKKGIPTVVLIDGIRFIRAHDAMHGKSVKKEVRQIVAATSQKPTGN